MGRGARAALPDAAGVGAHRAQLQDPLRGAGPDPARRRHTGLAEVKLRWGVGFGDPLEAVTPRKQATIRALAEQYLSEREPHFDAVRFDVVGILIGQGQPRIVHIEDAF